MAAAAVSLAFGEHATFEDNLTAFADYQEDLDPPLSSEFDHHLPDIVSGNYKLADVWNGLLLAAMDSVQPASASTGTSPSSQAPSVSGARPGAPQPSAQGAMGAPTPITGWLLEGVTIEGFRGINNQNQPLDLRFNPSKINSVSAVNGVGKSSVHDAIRYAITGKLPWLDELHASERGGEYHLNRFNTSGQAIIKLRLVADGSSDQCEITVVRDRSGNRRVTAPAPWQPNEILQALNREFVFLDGPTFHNFISSRPTDRGRTFSGLLGLSVYSEFRQALAAIANTRAFNNHFEVTRRAQEKAREDKAASDALAAIKNDFRMLVGTDIVPSDIVTAKQQCLAALVQIGPLGPLCRDVGFDEVHIDNCIEAIKEAEGGPKRERLGACIREQSALTKLNTEAPTAERARQLAEFATARGIALANSAGNLLLQLYQTGARIIEADPSQSGTCPLCDSQVPHDLRAHISGKIAQFDALDKATKALAVEWGEAGWSDLAALEAELEKAAVSRILAHFSPRASVGDITPQEAEDLVFWLKTLRSRADARQKELGAEQASLERDLPPSSVEVTKKVEAARRLQDNWRKFETARRASLQEAGREAAVGRIKTFLSDSAAKFASAETALSKARLTAVEPVFKSYFRKMSFFGVVPAIARRAETEDLQILLEDFYGLSNLSPQALLSESFRNAFAISLYLAAASLYGGTPKFIILDDVTSSFDAGHQHFLVELIRTNLARPGTPAGPQVILLSHDTMLEKLFNKHSNTGQWYHQRLEGSPQVSVLAQSGAVNKVRDRTLSMLQAGQVDFAKEGVRQYLEYRLSDLISRLRIPVPVDIAFNASKQLSNEFLGAIEAAVKLHAAASTLVLDQSQVAGLNSNMITIVSNFLSHWGTGQALAFTGASLQGVMQAIDDFCNCFTIQPASGSPVFYKSLSQRQ